MNNKNLAGFLLIMISILVLSGYFYLMLKDKMLLAVALVVTIVFTALCCLVIWVGFSLLRTKEPQIIDKNK